jgi:pyoverdine/dityrosine biosynthesis protein Dit1
MQTAFHFLSTRAFRRDAKRIFVALIVRRKASARVIRKTTPEMSRIGIVTTPTAERRRRRGIRVESIIVQSRA